MLSRPSMTAREEQGQRPAAAAPSFKPAPEVQVCRDGPEGPLGACSRCHAGPPALEDSTAVQKQRSHGEKSGRGGRAAGTPAASRTELHRRWEPHGARNPARALAVMTDRVVMVATRDLACVTDGQHLAARRGGTQRRHFAAASSLHIQQALIAAGWIQQHGLQPAADLTSQQQKSCRQQLLPCPLLAWPLTCPSVRLCRACGTGTMVQRLTYRRRHSYASKSNTQRIVKTPGAWQSAGAAIAQGTCRARPAFALALSPWRCLLCPMCCWLTLDTAPACLRHCRLLYAPLPGV